MSLYEVSVPQFKKMLKNVDKWLEAATDYAQKRSFDPNVLLSMRLAPDQYPLVRQVQAASDAAKFAAARLTGKDAPRHPDTEQTMDALRNRLRSSAAYLETFTPVDFAGAESRLVDLPLMEGKVLMGTDYLTEFALPNFYFHVTTAYAILRHNGVELGKRMFLGPLNIRDR
ncbi:MAG TPA: DUF1993 domain-containing protein [Vicinamibacterales bacterium]|nr:DUF1993 domain-containing protein [Vicinamibacterales bacterium]